MKGDCVGVTHTSSTRVCIGKQWWQGCQDGVEAKSMIGLVQVKRDMLRYVQDVRELGRGPSDHHVVPFKVRLVDR